ncbi:MAG: radical SAM protein [Tissierellia bacterium]|nr:radical SAM protein [Tissierellia bacterium]
MLKITQYHKFYEINSENGLLFNTWKGYIIKIDTSVYKKMLDVNDEKELKLLFGKKYSAINNMFFTDVDNEKEIMFKQLIKNKYNQDRLIITIMSTMDCNLRCVYCYQQGLVDRNINMTPKTIEFTKDWILKEIKFSSCKEIVFHLYGGEPMCNFKAFKGILPHVFDYCRNAGIKYSSYITTNGTIINKEILQYFKDWNMDNIQISVDGTQKIHDSRRIKVDGKGTFKIIMNNIKFLLDNDMKVVIRINVDAHNVDDIGDFFRNLKGENFDKYKKLQVNIELVSPIMYPSEHCTNYIFIDQNQLDSISKLWDLQVDNGFPIKSVMPIDSACEHELSSSFTIDPLGTIYLCPGFVGLEKFQIGNVYEGLDINKYKNLIKFNHWEECLDCEYVAICQGGCKMCAYVTTKKYESRYCRKEFIDNIYPNYLINKFLKENT